MGKEDDEALQRKRELYRTLDSLAHSDDDEPDPGRKSSMEAMARAVRPKPTTQKSAQGLQRSTSDSTNGNRAAGRPGERSLSGIPPTASQAHAKLTSRHTFSGVSGDAPAVNASKAAVPSMAGTKRKRKEDASKVPENQQIFKGLSFFFFPNNDKHPARKIRIAKAAEFGAVWAKDFDESVSRIIVDKGMEYKFLLKFLKRETIPSHIAVVSEDYTAECIAYKILLDPQQPRFRIKGHPTAVEARPVSASSEKSLELKSAGKSVTAREPETPSASGHSDAVPVSPSANEQGTRGDLQAEPPAVAAQTSKPTTSNIVSTDELDAAISQARELQHVPLDQDEEASSRPASSGGPDTDDEDAVTPTKPKSKYRGIQDKFQCMQKHTSGKAENPNATTIAILQQMADYYGKIGDEWRTRAYRKAMGTLRNHPAKVWTRAEALALPQIGERLATKIEEIAYTNRLRRLENAKAEPSDQTLQAFTQIYGVGYAQASKWVDAGYKTVDEVLAKAELTTNQWIGIEHYEDFNTRIPRAEVERHGAVVKKTLHKIDPAFEVIVGGSYRRGSATSGDIDCIITRPNTGAGRIREVILGQLIPKLLAQNFLVAELAITSRDDGSKWHGASQLPPSTPDATPLPWRRIDFLLVPSDELGAALIYFTGNDIFNRSMRLLAGTKGMRLNQRGLYKDVIRGKGREKLSEGTLVEGKDERRIFEVLGVPWRPPEHRIC
ncbi:uncharacterized protein LTR77_009518 [Saxophila tyrrhenica]|uniref:DNA polymerase lambda n=1 Tax=Saxophila tyrrhenica TaxID=1690608 RepID=A0AAV9NXW6_9PEZI|nr:hypothetical protein LTR77_009518 [Saxophila tyrrhenica]